MDLDFGVKTGGREGSLLEKKIVNVSKSRHRRGRCRNRYYQAQKVIQPLRMGVEGEGGRNTY